MSYYDSVLLGIAEANVGIIGEESVLNIIGFTAVNVAIAGVMESRRWEL